MAAEGPATGAAAPSSDSDEAADGAATSAAASISESDVAAEVAATGAAASSSPSSSFSPSVAVAPSSVWSSERVMSGYVTSSSNCTYRIGKRLRTAHI